MTGAAALQHTSLDLAPEHPPKPMTLRDARRLARALWGERGRAVKSNTGTCYVGVSLTPVSPPIFRGACGPTWEEAFAAAPLPSVR